MKHLPVAKQFQILHGTPQTPLYSGKLGGWYSSVMAHDSFDVNMMSRFLNPRSYVVDLMCGDGRNLRELSAQGHRGVGVDLNSSAIERARSITTQKNITYVIEDAFSWVSNVDADLVVFGGLVGSMFDKQELLSLFRHVRNYIKPNGKLLIDYLPAYAEDSNWAGDFILPTENPDNGFVVTSTRRNPMEGSQESSFFYYEPSQSPFTEYASHTLIIHDSNAVESLLLDAGFKIESSRLSHQFDPHGYDEGMPSWPIKKIQASRS